MSTTGTPIPTDAERVARPMNWAGALTVENSLAVKDRIERILGGRRYTTVTTYVGAVNQYANQTVTTSNMARGFELTIVPLNDDPGDDRKMAMIVIPDSQGTWFIDTSIPDVLTANLMTYENKRLAGAWFTLTENQVQFETRNHDGGLRVHTLAVESDYDLVVAARNVLQAYDADADDDGKALAFEIRWLRESLANGR